jgi:hypothetical protein
MNGLGYIKQENIPMHKKIVKKLVSYMLHACIIAYINLPFLGKEFNITYMGSLWAAL